jgi:predicted ester cyclase
MAQTLDRLLDLWRTPMDSRADPVADFAEFYADTVVVNGSPMPVTALVDRARALQQAFEDLDMVLLQEVETPDVQVIAFEMTGRHTGTFESPLGSIPATGNRVVVRTIDVLTLTAGRISAIWVQADELGMLRQLTDVALAEGAAPSSSGSGG